MIVTHKRSFTYDVYTLNQKVDDPFPTTESGAKSEFCSIQNNLWENDFVPKKPIK